MNTNKWLFLGWTFLGFCACVRRPQSFDGSSRDSVPTARAESDRILQLHEAGKLDFFGYKFVENDLQIYFTKISGTSLELVKSEGSDLSHNSRPALPKKELTSDLGGLAESPELEAETQLQQRQSPRNTKASHAALQADDSAASGARLDQDSGDDFVLIRLPKVNKRLVGNPALKTFGAHTELDPVQTSWWGSLDPRSHIRKDKPLFLDEPSEGDIVQTLSLNCPFLAGIAATLHGKGGDSIRDLVYDDLETGKVYVKIHDEHGIPYVYSMNKERDTRTGDVAGIRYIMSSRGKLWVHLLERAFDAHLKRFGEDSFPKTWRDKGLSPWLSLVALLGEDAFYEDGGVPTTPWFGMRDAFRTEQKLRWLSVPQGGLGIASLLPGKNFGALPQGHAYGLLSGIVTNEKDVAGVWLFNSLSSTQNIFVPAEDFVENFHFLFVPTNKNSPELKSLVTESKIATDYSGIESF